MRLDFRASLAGFGAITMFFLNSVMAASGTFKGLYFETKGSGKPVVFIHGGQMDRRMWDAQFDDFAKRYLVIRYDIRGFGKSQTPDQPYSQAGDLQDLLNHLEVKKAALIGLSLGAAVAIDFAILHPGIIDALVLVCPGLGGFRFEDEANNLRAVVEAARDERKEEVVELWLKNPYMNVAMENPMLRDRLRQLATENAHCWLNNPLFIRPLNPPAADRLREIHAPTLIIGGERDVSDIHRIVAKLASEIPSAKKLIIPRAGHLVPMEKPNEFNRVAVEFLTRANHEEKL